MFDTVKQKRREACRRKYRCAVELGYFLAARKLLRDALVWRSPTARYQSREWCYMLRDGKIHAFVYKCSY